MALSSFGAAEAAPSHWAETLQADPRLSEQLKPLQAGPEEVASLYLPNRARRERGAVVLLHGMRAHADWPEVIRPLREALPALGWATLSLQLPDPSAAATPEAFYQAGAARISAALTFLRGRSDTPIVLIGKGSGAQLGLWFLANEKDPEVAGMVAVSLRPVPGESVDDSTRLVSAVEQPVLEVFAERDHPRVLAGIADRRALIPSPGAQSAPREPSSPRRYRQIDIDGADPDYTAQAEVLVKRIRGWMPQRVDR